MDAALVRRAGLALLLTSTLIAGAVAPAGAAKRPSVRDGATYHWVHFYARGIGTTAPIDSCNGFGFGEDPGFCDAPYDEPTAWDATPPFRGTFGFIVWNANRPMAINFRVKDTPWHLYGKIPGPGSDRFTVTEADAPWPRASAIVSGDDPSVPAGQQGGPLWLDVEMRGVPARRHFEVKGWLLYEDPSAPSMRCPRPPITATIGQRFEIGCQLSGQPKPTLLPLEPGEVVPPGLDLTRTETGDRAMVSGTPTTLGDYRFNIRAINPAGGVLAPMEIEVEKAAPHATLISDPVRAVYGQEIRLTGRLATTITEPALRPTLPASFLDGEALLATAPLTVAETGTFVASIAPKLAVGHHPLSLAYPGDSVFQGARSETVDVEVAKGPTSPRVSSSLNPAPPGTDVTFSARVDPSGGAAGTPTGTVQFTFDGQPLGTPVDLVDGIATSPPASTLVSGPHAVRAAYSGDPNFEASSDELENGQRIAQEDTTTTVRSSDARSFYGEAVRFSAEVSPESTGARRKVTGEVQFMLDDKPLGDRVELAGGRAETGPVDDLAVGRHTVRARYIATRDFKPSDDELSGDQVVAETPTRTIVTSSRNPSAVGDPVTFTITVRSTDGGGVPPGTVGVRIDDQQYDDPLPLKDGATSVTVPGLRKGHHTVEGVFRSSVEPGYRDSSGHLDGGQQVNRHVAEDDEPPPVISPGPIGVALRARP